MQSRRKQNLPKACLRCSTQINYSQPNAERYARKKHWPLCILLISKGKQLVLYLSNGLVREHWNIRERKMSSASHPDRQVPHKDKYTLSCTSPINERAVVGSDLQAASDIIVDTLVRWWMMAEISTQWKNGKYSIWIELRQTCPCAFFQLLF